MAKATSIECNAIRAKAVTWMANQLVNEGKFDFMALCEHVLSVSNGKTFNWMPVVRNPMQCLINAGCMARDVTDICGPELYRAGPNIAELKRQMAI